jgi:hypothetical protein
MPVMPWWKAIAASGEAARRRLRLCDEKRQAISGASATIEAGRGLPR